MSQVYQLDLGPVRPVYKGAWSASATYEILNIVMHEAYAWILVTDSYIVGDEPVEGSSAGVSASGRWAKLAYEGHEAPVMAGAAASAAGAAGLVPAPAAGDEEKCLRGDGTWKAIPVAGTALAGLVQLSDSTSESSSEKAATPTAVKSAYDLAAAALPTSGGTMTSEIKTDADGSFIRTGTTGRLGLYGGTNWQHGAMLTLGGYANSSQPGWWQLITSKTDGTGQGPALVGKADGTLTWNGKSLQSVPQAAAGVGQFVRMTTGKLPTGGTWAYFVLCINSGEVQWTSSSAKSAAGVAAGAATVLSSGTSFQGFAWRIQ